MKPLFVTDSFSLSLSAHHEVPSPQIYCLKSSPWETFLPAPHPQKCLFLMPLTFQKRKLIIWGYIHFHGLISNSAGGKK